MSYNHSNRLVRINQDRSNIPKLKLKSALRLSLVCLCASTLMLVAMFLSTNVSAVITPPKINLVGGKFYLSVDGVILTRLDSNNEEVTKYYNTDHTAKEAAINEAFNCRCEVQINQEPVRVNATYFVDSGSGEPVDNGDTGGSTEEPVYRSIALSWDMPAKREDGSELPPSEIKGYVIAWGTLGTPDLQQITIEGATNLTTVLEDLPPSTYVFAIATVDSDGVQGAWSCDINNQSNCLVQTL